MYDDCGRRPGERGQAGPWRGPHRIVLGILLGSSLLTAAWLLAGCSSGSSSTSTTLDRAAATTSIIDTVNAVFHGASGTAASKVALVQQGRSIEGALNSYFSLPTTKASTARVSQVDLLDPPECGHEDLPWPCARVTDDILLSGKPSLSGEKTYLVETGGRWKVAEVTMCGLMALRSGGETPLGC